METIYIKRHRPSEEAGASQFVVPAVGIRSREGLRLIPHPYGTETTTFDSLEITVEQVHRAGYAAEFEGRHFPLPPRHGMQPTRPSPRGKSDQPMARLVRDAIPMLHAQLKDNAPAVVASAAHALGELRDETALVGLFHALSHEDATVRKHATEALAKIGRPALPGIQQALQDKHWLVRHSALATLIECVYRQLDLVPELLPYAQALLKDESWLVRSQAATAYAEVAKALRSRQEADTAP